MNTEDTTSEGQQSVAETSSSSLIDKVRTSDQNQNRDLVEQLSNLVINQRNDRWILADSTLAQGPVTLYFCEARHDGQNSAIVGSENGTGLVAKWRSKERLKTTAVALVMALNIGVTPPDVIQISPCARLVNWVDPFSMQAPKALDTIGKNLQAQYERWQPRAKYRLSLDPTTSDVQRICLASRKTAKNERVLFHFNGLGVPRPTTNGEIWVFNKSYTQYIPLSLYDLQSWLGTPAIYVFDCSMAGQILVSFKQFMVQRQQEVEGYPPYQGQSSQPDPMRDCILLCACSENELLPQNPDLPADVFTSCLTTPIKIALRWFCSRSMLRHEGITKELIDRIPGKQTDRKTPLGELNWIFTAITDTIAWNVLPRALFQKLFRQDLLVASLFRNFLLADRIMRAANCTPVSYPRLPPTHQHFMWQAWDMAAEMCLLQLPELLNGDGTKEYQPSPFFSEQLTAFELWLEHGTPDKRPPEQLPIVLQVLLSQVHRLRALILLGRFLDLGSWAVDLALSVGIFPYVLKLLQTTAADLRQTLVFIWTKILAWDANSQVQSDLVKDGGHLYFIKHLESHDPALTPESRAQAAFVLAAICNHHPKGQLLCAQAGLLQLCVGQLPATLAAMASAEHENPVGARRLGLLAKWLLLCVGKLCEDVPEISSAALERQVHDMLAKLLASEDPEIRAAAVFSLSALIQAHETVPSEHTVGEGSEPHPHVLPEQERMVIERAIACALLEVVYDASPLVRCEVARGFGRLALGHQLLFQDAVHVHQETAARMSRAASADDIQRVVSSAPADAVRYTHSSLDSKVNLPGQGSIGAIRADSSSPGVRVRDDQSFESLLHVGTDGGSFGKSNLFAVDSPVQLKVDEQSTPTGAGGIYASADAARVGGGLYLAVVEAMCTLATDPAPQVCEMGIECLKAANVEFVANASAPSVALVPSLPTSVQGSKDKEHSGMASFLPKSWQSKSWRSSASTSKSPAPLTVGGSVGSKPSSPGVSPRGYGGVMRIPMPSRNSRQPFILKKVRESLDVSTRGGNAFRTLNGAGVQSIAQLPHSICYSTSSEHFRWPLLLNRDITREQQYPWLAPPDNTDLNQRIHERETALEYCATVSNPRLQDQVITVQTSAEQNVAVCFDAFESTLTTADARGNICVCNYAQQVNVNKFSIGTEPIATKSLFVLNQLYNSLLIVCSRDGAIRVWRDWAVRGGQRLATAWQGCLLSSSVSPASYSLPGDGHPLHVAKQDVILSWDLARESCTGKFTFTTEANQPARIEHIVASRSQPILYAADSAGQLALFDLRSGQQEWSLQPHKSAVAGLVDMGDTLVAGYPKGHMLFMDTRKSGATAVSTTVEAHTTTMVSIAGHQHASVLASVSATQTMKVWSASGQSLGVVRPRQPYLERVGAALTCAWHPLELKLAVGAADPFCSVYSLTS